MIPQKGNPKDRKEKKPNPAVGVCAQGPDPGKKPFSKLGGKKYLKKNNSSRNEARLK